VFTDFFFILRKYKLPVSLTEWMTLIEALAKGHINSLDDFYFLGRAILIKNEKHFDSYDMAFQEYFTGIETPVEILEQVLEWLKNPVNPKFLTEEEKAKLRALGFQELMKMLEERLKEQKGEHHGGNYWIGSGGTSPFGHSGYHPSGVRIGGIGRNHSAMQVAMERHFMNYRSDVTLDVRQIKVALHGLRLLTHSGEEEQLDIEGTVKATAKNAGDLEFIWEKNRKNNLKLLLMMDAGGSMDEYIDVCNQLFSAANSINHFKDFQYYYFHNCVYDRVYKDIAQRDAVATDHLLKVTEQDYKVIMVGDASMSSWELFQPYGDYSEMNVVPGIKRLHQLKEHFSHIVWLNPTEREWWSGLSVQSINKLFPMYPLTLDGLEEAIKKLMVK
jgi:uncharacterized protein